MHLSNYGSKLNGLFLLYGIAPFEYGKEAYFEGEGWVLLTFGI